MESNIHPLMILNKILSESIVILTKSEEIIQGHVHSLDTEDFTNAKDIDNI